MDAFLNPENLALGVKQYGGQQRAHHVGDGAGEPDARQSVVAGIGEKQGHDINQRQQEQQLARKAGEDGNPGLVYRLEEVGVDDGEGNQREHYHHKAHSRSADAEKFGIGGEDFDHRDGE